MITPGTAGSLSQEPNKKLLPRRSAEPLTLRPPCNVAIPVTPSVFTFAVPEVSTFIVAVPEASVPMVAVPDTLRLVPVRLCPKEWGAQRNIAQIEPTRAAMVFLVIGFSGDGVEGQK